ncbi:hypothetical protein TEA_020948 [Camellia sinensis var. sinensis]|uniref:Uncharacterized protein n=1 Tax=Camellia sinensis var. sinensis TaxID=542762 RepID=A0A4S4ETH7_CAMSN|nr:hypothetical protein TEA_020948 [Camellia sinensis var. sinensis]
MAARDHHHYHSKKNTPPSSSSSYTSLLFLSLLCLASLFLVFSLFKTSSKASLSPQHHRNIEFNPSETNNQVSSDRRLCDYSDGKWIYDPTVRSARYDHSCKEIFKGWNCIASNKSNALDIVNWRWKPNHCDLPQFDPLRFLQRYRDTNIGFIGDSLNRNMFVSLFCTLKRVSGEVKKWRPAGADRGFTFLQYNLTIAYHRTTLLARYGSHSGFSNQVILEFYGKWVNVKHLNILAWYESLASNLHCISHGLESDESGSDGFLISAIVQTFCVGVVCPQKLHSFETWTSMLWSANTNGGVLESLGYKEGYRVDVDIPEGTWAEAMSFHDILIFNTGHWWWAPSKFDPVKSPMLFFENGLPVMPPVPPDVGLDMVLKHTVEELFSLRNNGTNVEARLVNQHLYKALNRSGFNVLDITRMSEFRADAHPSTAGGKKHDDCMHWCLPGITDTWNDLFIAYLNNIKGRN